MKDSNSDQFDSVTGGPESSPSSAPDQAAAQLKSGILTDARDLTDEATQLAGGVLSHARESASDQISSGKARVAEGLGSVAEAIRHAGEDLRSKDAANLTEYASRAADQVEAASDYLKESSLSDVVGDIGDFARREPAMFLGGAFVLGLVGGRFLKSSHAQTDTTTRRPRALGVTAGGTQTAGDRQAKSLRDSSGALATRKPAAASDTRNGGTKRASQSGLGAANGDGAKMPGAV